MRGGGRSGSELGRSVLSEGPARFPSAVPDWALIVFITRRHPPAGTLGVVCGKSHKMQGVCQLMN